LLLSEVTSTHALLQTSWPDGQVKRQVPDVQLWPVGQALPQAPQLPLS
jgi:hypothetical protein